MKVVKPFTLAVCIAFVGHVSAAKQATTKDLALDPNIVPTWEQLGANANSYKITLERVNDYWAALETRDISAVKGLYSTKAEDKAAKAKVESFYDGATACLNKQSTKERKTRAQIDAAFQAIKDCIAKDVTTPVFTVATTVNWPPNSNGPVSFDYWPYVKADEDADLKEYSKTISLDTTVPTWDQLGTNADSYKIKLNRLKTYWAEAEARGKEVVANFYSTKAYDDDAVKKVAAFYDTAETCLEKQSENQRKTRSEFDAALKEINDCIAKKATPLVFTVVKTVNLPAGYYQPLMVDFSAAIKSDEADDLKEAPKDTSLDSNIVPTWDQLGTSATTYKIKLERVSNYWAALEKRDIRAVKSFYSKDADDKTAKAKVEAFYDGAEACLAKQSPKDRKTRAEIDTALQQLKACITQTVTVPVFTAFRITTLPSDYWNPVTVDYTAAIKTDEDADLKEYGKEIALDTTVPSWDQLGTNANSVKIKLNRLKTYWAAAEARDKKAAESFYVADKNVDAAVKKVTDFYDDAETCLEKQYETVRKTRAEIDAGLKEINDCIAKKATPLVFTVLKTVNVPADYFTPLVVDYSKAIAADEEADRKEATPAPTPAPPTKQISLDYDIVPTWDQLGTTAKTTKIRLYRIYGYWDKTEARDKKAVKTFYTTTKEDNAAAAKIDDFYSGAKACLAKQKELEKKTRAQVDVALQQIRECIVQSVVPPIFTVLATVKFPDDYFSPVAADFGGANKEDEEEDAAEAAAAKQTSPIVTTAPLVTPVPVTESPAALAAPVIVETAAPYSPVITETTNEPTSINAPEEDMPEPIFDDEQPSPNDTAENELPQEPTGNFSPPENSDTGNFVPTPDEEEPTAINGVEPQSPSNEVTNDGEPQPESNGNPDESVDTGNFAPGLPAPEASEPSVDEPTSAAQPEPSNVDANGSETPAEVTTNILDGTVPIADLPDAQALEWPFSPASPDVPPRWALDLDDSQSVDASEWQKYIERLHTLAREAVVRGNDPVAVALLKQIVDFHYGSLAQCITSKLKTDAISVLDDSDYEPVAHWIEINCYVKFRYSLLAGAPPFEWISKDKPIVTAQEIESWFTKRVKTARKDITQLPNVSPAQKEIVERFIGCAYASLNAAGAVPIHRDAFYSALTHIEQCASA